MPAHAGNWIITPRVGGQELFTDNVLLTPTNRRSDFVTSISPGINITGESSRLQGTLDYSPSAYLYALTPSQDFIGQNLYANGTATVIRDFFFIDARGYASLQPSIPGLATGAFNAASPLSGISVGPGNPSPGVSKAQLTQTSSFSASPYLVHRFDGFGTGELRYTISNTNFSGGNSTLVVPPGVSILNTNTTTNEATAAFFTGENFGPLSSRLLFDAAQSTGVGVNNANQRLTIVDSAYAINRRIAVLGTIGHENLHFGGFPVTAIDDVVWGIGLNLKPVPDATITASYGHRNGVTAPYLAIVYPLSARTTLSATYSEGLSTTAQDVANNLAVSNVNAAGQLIDTRTLLPSAIVNPVLGLQSGLFRSKQFTATADVVLARNHIAASIYRSDNLLVGQSRPGSGTSQEATGGNVTWSRQISPLTTANLGIGYTHYSFPTPGAAEENLLTVGAAVSYMLSTSLTTWAGYNRLDRSSPSPQLRLTSNIVFIGLNKSF